MKVPLEQEPFPPVDLTRNQEQQLEWLSDALLDETLAEYHDYVHNNNRVLDKALWKQAMARENVTMYKRIGRGDPGGVTPDVTLYQTDPTPSTITWRVPRVVGVGTLPGNIEEVIYGMLAPSKRETDIRTTYTKDDAGDGRVIAQLLRPTDQDPLRSLLVRWTLVYQFIHKYVVTPRDVVNMESIGIRVMPNGDRIGYIMLQSVDVPGCEELVDLGIIRCKFSSCYIFRDTGNGSVELYMRGFVEPGGSMPDNVAVVSACISLIAIWRLMICGQNKKIVRMIKNQRSKPSIFDQAQDDSTCHCGLCRRSVSAFRSPVTCDVCGGKVCSKCADNRKLTHARTSGQLVRVTTKVCRMCMTVAAKTPASEVAMSEHVPTSARSSRHRNTHSSSSSSTSSRSNPATSASPEMGAWLTRREPTKISLVDHSSSSSCNATAVEDAGYESDASSISFSEEPFTIGSPAYTRSSAPSVTAVLEDHEESSQSQSQVQLWLQMNKLRVAAEETYILTQRNASAMAVAHQLDSGLRSDSAPPKHKR